MLTTGDNKMKINRKIKKWLILSAGILLSAFWMFFFAAPAYPAWQKLDDNLPETIYFPIEEFLALNCHHNSLYVYIGGAAILSGAVLLVLKLEEKLQKWYKYILLIFVLFLLQAILFPCLCRPVEYGRRALCKAMLRQAYSAIELYAEKNGGAFPETLDDNALNHPVIYYGKGKTLNDKPFIILADGIRRLHAGDMCHRIWSNGECDVFYPWRDEKEK